MEMILYEDFLDNLEQPKDLGRYILALCPFHDDAKPSMLVFKDGWFRCLGCNRHGTWRTLWNKVKGQNIHIQPDSRTAWNAPIRKGEDLETICYEGNKDLTAFPTLQWYLEMRGIQDRIDVCGLGYKDGWYSVPVYNREGEFITGVFRAAPHVQEVTGLRYWAHGEPVMYVPDWRLYDKEKYLIVVFGIFDALCISSLRYPVATSSSGNLTFKAEWLEDTRKIVYVIPDKGEEEVGMKLANNLGWRGKLVRLDYPDGCKDPADFFPARRDLLKSHLSNLR